MFVPSFKPRLEDEHAAARRLRTEGWSIKRIASELDVSPSSVLRWTADIQLTPQQVAANLARARNLRTSASSDLYRRKRARHQQEGRERARLGEPLHVAGCMLYWAEGAKERNSVVFANSDTAMMSMFVRFLRECFSLTADDTTFRLNVYTDNGLTVEQVENHWISELALSRRCVRKHVVDHLPTSSSGRRQNKLRYGVCTLRVKRSTWLVQHIYGAIQEYSGIDKPAWLDGPPRREAEP